MDIKISKEIIKQTTQCKRDFACLSGKPEDLCEVDYRPGKWLLCMKSRKNPICDYCGDYGNSGAFCLCPTRKELYRRYGI